MLYDVLEQPAHRPPPHRLRPRLAIGVALLGGFALVAVIWGGMRMLKRGAKPDQIKSSSAVAEMEEKASRIWPLGRMTFATSQTALLDGDPEQMFMPTASGRLEAAFYGSTRRARDGRPSFHEGVDIAPLRRDRSGRALDDIHAVADGRVAHISPHPGNSNYGIYVVLFHDDALGEIYTLYAHMASVVSGLHIGQAVAAGTVLGRMGRTPARIIPVARSHLHFEIGVIVNRAFDEWLKKQSIPSPHGIGHGWNLMGVDPMAVWRAQRDVGELFTLQAYVASLPTAFSWVVRSAKCPDYFARYPTLWHGPLSFQGPAFILELSEGGVPLAGRPATAAETAALQGSEVMVLDVDEAVLGGNGRRLVEQVRGNWHLSAGGRQWLDFFLFSGRVCE